MRRYGDVYYCNAVLGRSINEKVNGDVYFVMLFWAEVEMRSSIGMFICCNLPLQHHTSIH